MTPNVVYARLPKEGVYVNIQDWEHEYLKSQVQELIYIFRLIGVQELTIKTSQQDDEKTTVGGSIGVDVLGIEAEAGIVIKNESSNYDAIQTHLVFDKSIKATVPTLDELMVDENIYYLQHRPAWISFVNNRLKGRATTIEFTFTHHDMIHMKHSFVTRLQRLGIAVKYNIREVTWVKMEFKGVFDRQNVV